MKLKGSPKLMREINSSIILDLLKEKAPLSKYEISKITGLSAPAVSKIVTDLIKIGIIKVVGIGESIGGRPPVLLDLDLEGGFIIGIDVGNDDVTAIVVNFLGNVVSKVSISIGVKDSEFIIFDKIINSISQTIERSGKDRSLFLGMGIGVSGDIDTVNGVVRHATRLNWYNVPLKSIVENSFHLPVYINENVRLLSFAENWYGAGKNYDNIVCIRIGDDIGAGIIIAGELFDGSNSKAGVDIGHMIIDPDGEECICGNKGCLGTLISSDAIIKRSENRFPELASITVKDIAKLAKSGDDKAAEIMDETAKWLALALMNIITLLDPEIIIIGGGIAEAGEVLFEPVRKHMREHSRYSSDQTRVVPSILGPDAYAIGAAAVVLHKVFLNPKSSYGRKQKKQASPDSISV